MERDPQMKAELRSFYIEKTQFGKKNGLEKRYENESKTLSKRPPGPFQAQEAQEAHSELWRLRTPFQASGPGILQPLGKTI